MFVIRLMKLFVLNVVKLLVRKQKRWCDMNPLNMNLLNSIVSYKDCFYYIDKLYKTNGVYDGVVRIRSIEDDSITIRIMFKALTKVSN